MFYYFVHISNDSLPALELIAVFCLCMKRLFPKLLLFVFFFTLEIYLFIFNNSVFVFL